MSDEAGRTEPTTGLDPEAAKAADAPAEGPVREGAPADTKTDLQGSKRRSRAPRPLRPPTVRKPRALSDDALRDVIRSAASGAPTWRTLATTPPQPGKLRLQDRSLSKRMGPVAIPAARMRLVAGVFLTHWLLLTVSGVLLAHFGERPGAAGQSFMLLASSLATFTAAIVATIELFKFTAAGRSVAIGLAFVNVLVSALLASYGMHWLHVVVQAGFAVGLVGLLAPDQRSQEDESARSDRRDASEVEPTTGLGWSGAATRGAILIATMWGLLLLGTLGYRVLEQVAAAEVASLSALGPAHQADPAAADRLDVPLAVLPVMMWVVGESPTGRAEIQGWIARQAIERAAWEAARREADRSLGFALNGEALRLKAFAFQRLQGTEAPLRTGTPRLAPDDRFLDPAETDSDLADPRSEVDPDEFIGPQDWLAQPVPR